MAGRCRYWIIIKEDKGVRPSLYKHFLHYERLWSTGWSGIPKYKNTIQKIGSFDTRSQMISYYWANQPNLPGGVNSMMWDMSEHPVTCDDQ